MCWHSLPVNNVLYEQLERKLLMFSKLLLENGIYLSNIGVVCCTKLFSSERRSCTAAFTKNKIKYIKSQACHRRCNALNVTHYHFNLQINWKTVHLCTDDHIMALKLSI